MHLTGFPVREPNDTPLVAFENKVACLFSASPGALGGLRGLVTLRSILGNIKTIVIPDSVSIQNANDAFDEKENLKDPKKQEAMEKAVKNFVATVRKMNG